MRVGQREGCMLYVSANKKAVSLNLQRYTVVGNGGSLLLHNLGKRIDAADGGGLSLAHTRPLTV
jgi:hypothetical protein